MSFRILLMLIALFFLMFIIYLKTEIHWFEDNTDTGWFTNRKWRLLV